MCFRLHITRNAAGAAQCLSGSAWRATLKRLSERLAHAGRAQALQQQQQTQLPLQEGVRGKRTAERAAAADARMQRLEAHVWLSSWTLLRWNPATAPTAFFSAQTKQLVATAAVMQQPPPLSARSSAGSEGGGRRGASVLPATTARRTVVAVNAVTALAAGERRVTLTKPGAALNIALAPVPTSAPTVEVTTDGGSGSSAAWYDEGPWHNSVPALLLADAVARGLTHVGASAVSIRRYVPSLATRALRHTH